MGTFQSSLNAGFVSYTCTVVIGLMFLSVVVFAALVAVFGELQDGLAMLALLIDVLVHQPSANQV